MLCGATETAVTHFPVFWGRGPDPLQFLCPSLDCLWPDKHTHTHTHTHAHTLSAFWPTTMTGNQVRLAPESLVTTTPHAVWLSDIEKINTKLSIFWWYSIYSFAFLSLKRLLVLARPGHGFNSPKIHEHMNAMQISLDKSINQMHKRKCIFLIIMNSLWNYHYFNWKAIVSYSIKNV